MTHVSYSYEDEEDQHDLDIEVVPHENLDPNPAPIPYKWTKPKWDQNLIEAVGNGVGNPEDRRRTWSHYPNEHVALSHTASLSTKWCNKIPGKCDMMIANDQPLGPQKKKNDHSPPLPYRRNTYNIHHFRKTLRGSHT